VAAANVGGCWCLGRRPNKETGTSGAAVRENGTPHVLCLSGTTSSALIHLLRLCSFDNRN